METAFELKDVLDEFFIPRRRSMTLFGDAPVRAVQSCPPYCEGSGYGYQLGYPGIGLALRPPGSSPRVQMLDELAPGFDYSATVQALVDEGWLSSDSWWWRHLRKNWWWVDEADSTVTWIWTGLLLRVRPGYCVRVTELFNAPQLLADVQELVYAASAAWIPLCLPVRLAGSTDCVLRGGIASLGALDADAAMAMTTLDSLPEAGARDVAFYDPEYYEVKATGTSTRKYARLRRQGEDAPAITDRPLLVLPHAGLAAQVQLTGLPLYDALGPVTGSGTGPVVATFYTPGDIDCEFLGRSFRTRMDAQWRQELRTTVGVWRELYGAAGERCLFDKTQGGETAVHPTAGPPALVLNVEPLIKFAAPSGWRNLFEGARQGPLRGLRGLIASDRFHTGAFAYQCLETPHSFRMPAGGMLGRVLPLRQATAAAQCRWAEGAVV